ncbi:MAG: HTTM domain-containing protein [Pseudomonadota bacterium]
MSFEDALRLTEALLAFALIQQSLEHMASTLRDDRLLFAPRLVLGCLLLASFAPGWVCLALIGHSLVALRRFDGPYNGGSDRMTLLALMALTAAHLAPAAAWKELALAYLALQLTLSYLMSGAVKLANPDWRTGAALSDVFRFSAYPVSEGLRGLASRRLLLTVMSWLVILFELLFPLGLLHPHALIGCLGVAAVFHFANACLFGLNRFFWAWLAAFPSLLWLQERLIGGG